MAEAALLAFVDSVFAPPKDVRILDAKFRPLLGLLSPNIRKMSLEKDAMLAAAREYARNPTHENRIALDGAIYDYNQNPLGTGAEKASQNLAQTAQRVLSNNATELKTRIDKAKSKMSPEAQARITPELVEEFRMALEEFAAKRPGGGQPSWRTSPTSTKATGRNRRSRSSTWRRRRPPTRSASATS